ncbi:MAG TPA: hypothetical protein VMT85_24720 [Thermoanaerobaculia bacterium]|nr:hypothetical protein [Thermoanaerobaculia bacterium]
MNGVAGADALDAGPRTGSLALMRRCHPLIERLERLDQLARGQDPAGWRRLAGLAAAFTLAAGLPAIRPPAPLLRPDPAVPGCLAERYAVLAELARQTAASPIRGRTDDTPPTRPPGAEP